MHQNLDRRMTYVVLRESVGSTEGGKDVEVAHIPSRAIDRATVHNLGVNGGHKSKEAQESAQQSHDVPCRSVR